MAEDVQMKELSSDSEQITDESYDSDCSPILMDSGFHNHFDDILGLKNEVGFGIKPVPSYWKKNINHAKKALDMEDYDYDGNYRKAFRIALAPVQAE